MKNINICLAGEYEEILAGVEILKKKLGITLCETGIVVEMQGGCDSFTVRKASDTEGYYIGYSEKAEAFRGLALLCAALREGKEIDINEKRQFQTVGSMMDLSRGIVLKKEVIFDFLQYHALMGLNMFMLYTEDTYELENYPWFGYLRGKYTKAELKEIDDYAFALGIEVIPCIQTLGHLATTLRWPAMAPVKDTANVLLVGAEETYVFIEEMIQTMRECFRSERIHIGMDEAFGLGSGNYKKLFGERSHQEIMVEHLERVCTILEKYDYKPMIWSDMFFRMSGKTGEYEVEAEIPADLKDTLPKNLEMVYWDYCMEDGNTTDIIISKHEEMERPVVFAGGIWTWSRTCTCFRKSLLTAKAQVPMCAKHGVDTLIATIWGNDCFEPYTAIPALQIWAELTYHTAADEALIAERFRACTGFDYDDWQLLYADDFTEEERALYDLQPKFCINSTSQHLHGDIFFGFLDKTLSGYDFKSKYDGLRKAIAKVDAGNMQPLFERHRILYEILYRKSDLGLRLRAAYKAGDRAVLEALAVEITELTELYKQYHDSYTEMWYTIGKPFGYSLADRRLSGSAARVHDAKQRLDGYLAGKYERLEELEEEILPYGNEDKPLREVNYANMFMTLL